MCTGTRAFSMQADKQAGNRAGWAGNRTESDMRSNRRRHDRRAGADSKQQADRWAGKQAFMETAPERTLT